MLLRHTPVRALCVAALLAALTLTTACSDGRSAADYVTQASASIAAGKAEQAYIELLNAVERDAELAQARFLLGKLQLETGAALDAKPALILAQQLGWPAEQVQPLLAQAFLTTGELDDLFNMQTQGLAAPAVARILAVQAIAKLRQAQQDEAQQLVQQALNHAQDDRSARSDVHIVAAHLALEAQQYGAALAALDSALEDAPQNSRAWELLGAAQAALGLTDKARDAYGKAADYATLSISPRFNRALLDLQLGDIEAARQDVALLEAIAPRAPATRYAAGLLHLEQKDYDEALRALDDARPLSDQYPLIEFGLATAHLYTGDVALARELAMDSFERNPYNVENRKLLAALEIINTEFDHAMALLQPILDRNPTELEALYLMAAAQARSDHGESALGTYLWIGQINNSIATTADGGFALPSAALGEAPLTFEDTGDKPENDILEIARLIHAQNFDGAISIAQNLRWQDTQTLNGHHVLTRAYLMAGQTPKARETLASALTSDPQDPVSNIIMAELALQEGKIARAEQSYRLALEKDAHHLPTLLRLAALEQRNGNDTAFQTNLRQAMHAHPQAMAPRVELARHAIGTGNAREVDALLQPLNALQKQSPPIVYLQLLAQLAQQEPKMAEQTLAAITRSKPGSEAFAYGLVHAAAAQRALPAIKPVLINAVRSNPTHLPTLLALATVAKIENDEAALRFFTTALETLHPQPESPLLLPLRAAARASDGQFDQAIALAEQAMAAHPSSSLAVDLSRYQLAADQRQQARATLERWVKAHPQDNAARLVLAQMLEQHGEQLAAAFQYGALLQQQPEHVIALNNLAWLTREQDPATALALIERAHKVAPNRAEVLDTLGVIQGINGQHKEALQSLNRALQAQPGNPDIRFHRIQVLAEMGSRQAAIREARALLLEFPSFAARAETEQLVARLQP
ncbi:MAG: PEP-CTERM system TPR-repeat protein PrsT [Gammaproteobacteria bacterium]|nr:PEP-CTERM system TPR-repeat protein PrsT [Gammaproteobacteria bacterium]